MNLKYMKVSLFEISYKKKNTFSQHSNFLRCTCVFDCAKVYSQIILQVHFKYLAFKDGYYITEIIQSLLIVIVKHILGIIL